MFCVFQSVVIACQTKMFSLKLFQAHACILYKSNTKKFCEMFGTNSFTESQATFYSKSVVRTVTNCNSYQSNRTWLSDIESKNPLVVMFPWLQYNPKAVEKFVQVYVSQNLDVLTFRLPVLTVTRVSSGDEVSKNLILPCLLSANHSEILVHGFCVGAFVLSRAINFMTEAEKKQVFGKVKAQIWDSIIREETAALGAAQTLVSPNWPRLLNSMHWLMNFYMNNSNLKESVAKCQEIFDSCPIAAPGIFLASESDPLGSVHNAEVVKKNWEKAKGIKCSIKTWKDSDHVGHMKKYPEEYWNTVESFLKENGFPNVKNMWETQKNTNKN